jgi:26S proteasome regulatory subunit, ATPase 3, interacting protein
MEEKLNKLRSGVTLVKPEDKKIIENSFAEKVSQWKRRKRMFKELWDNITEHSPKDQKEFKVLAASPLPLHPPPPPKKCF